MDLFVTREFQLRQHSMSYSKVLDFFRLTSQFLCHEAKLSIIIKQIALIQQS